MKILILEDEATLNDALAEFLSDAGYVVRQCFDGEEALEAAYEGIYDLLLLDVSVPGIDGFSLFVYFQYRKVSVLLRKVYFHLLTLKAKNSV